MGEIYLVTPVDVLALEKREIECVVPVKAIAIGEFVALLTIVTLPVALPTEAGAKTRLSIAVRLGVSVVAERIPLAVNRAPATVTPEIVTAELPVFVTAMFWDLLLPILTAPKATPAPLTGIVCSAGVPFIANTIDPVTTPAEVGSNTAPNEALPPAGIVLDVAS
jgi:hypothetical protein